ncbi:hypothetical protein O181_024288 [Austropuccinia psidii MF-1]|uniref:Secreted protein n=1 Tax=Austropuccinia psidii MF-1 TaxID=1389203 RepID=A0A9Q3CKI2_9BASI|nr:hypothetical protein [Austropuccinia psidii MF-1]
MTKVYFLVAICFTLIAKPFADAAKHPPTFTCETYLHPINSSNVVCKTDSARYTCPLSKCGDLPIFHNCKGRVTQKNFPFVWAEEYYPATSDQNTIIAKGSWSTSADAKPKDRTGMIEYASCGWTKSSEPNAKRRVCENCTK